MTDKLSITNEMRCFDLKDRDFYDSLTDEERRKFSNYLMIRWGSSVTGQRELQEFYVIATNERLNRHFFAVSRHPRLQWLMATTVSPGMGTHRHQWIAPAKRTGSDSAVRKTLMTMYPTAKQSDIDVMIKTMTKAEINELVQDHGD
jgi:hypothetical protein